MNFYACYWKGLKCIVEAKTTYDAQQLSIPEFKRVAGRKKVNSYDITVMLIEKDGTTVNHNGSEL